MKSIDCYKEAVMRRAEEKKRARTRAVRRTLAVCLPLFLCLGVIGGTLIPRALPIGEDRVPEQNDGALTEASDNTVRHGDTLIAVIDDAEAVYTAILALYTADNTCADNLSTGHSYGSAEEATDGEDAESFLADSGLVNGAAPYYLHFTRPEGLHTFLLHDNVLTDLTSGNSILVTTEQAQALMNGETP